MSVLLSSLYLAPCPKKQTAISGLVSVNDDRLIPTNTSERIARESARLLEGSNVTKNIPIDFIFFRRFTDGRSSQVAAYVLDNSANVYTKEQIAELHYRVWLNGVAPLLYVEWPMQIDILRCAAKPDFWDNKKENRSRYKPHDVIKVTSEISLALESIKVDRYSAYKLSDGTFWDNPENADWACASAAAHNMLIQAVIDADRILDGPNRPLMRRLLLLFILAKYLEDRGVFPKENGNWFSQFQENATCFLDLFASGNVQAVKNMLIELRIKFNWDIFDIADTDDITTESLREFYLLLEAKTIEKQRYLWKQFSFNYIPVEVLSHLYQHFAQKDDGAVFTPPLVVDLMLDYAMPYKGITGNESIFDPTCGSGIFLVGAYRRLVCHWKEQHGWKKQPTVEDLQKILHHSIYGAELDGDSAHIAVFNLALAVCDALQPEIIWNRLKFDKLIDTNIFVGDVFENLDKIRKIACNGFSIILGNPPFKSKLTKASLNTRPANKRKIPIPDKQIAYRILEESIMLLAHDGRLCMLQPSGFLYNSRTHVFRREYFTSHTVEFVLDFVSIRSLFEGADPKAVAIIANQNPPLFDHKLKHLTFRKTKSVHDRIGFELDHYDVHEVTQKVALQQKNIWKINLLGGGRLAYLAEKMATYPTMLDYWRRQGWIYGEGFIEGRAPKRGLDKRKPANWLTGHPFLPTRCFRAEGITESQLTTVDATVFESPGKSATFTPPMLLIRQDAELPMVFWGEEKGYLTFLQRIFAINGTPETADLLFDFFQAFKKNKKLFSALCLLRSPEALVSRSASILVEDLKQFPWPDDFNEFKLSWWEKILLDDILEYTNQLIRIGANANVYKKTVETDEFEQYSSIFTQLLRTVYTNLTPGKYGKMGGLAYQSFYFGESCQLNWSEDWSTHLRHVVHQNNSAIYTTRIIRFYEKNTFIIVKPELLRYWIPSTAIWDADETLLDMLQQGY